MTELEKILERFRTNREIGGERDVATIRRGYDAMGDDLPIRPDATFIVKHHAGMSAEWVRVPGVREDTVVLFFHGGGYMVGSARGYRSLTAALSEAAGAVCLAIDYRLAPESPFPAAVDDAVGAYRALLDSGIAAGRVAFAGDSAGGGLTLAAMLAARTAGLPMPAAGYGMSPWLDLESTGASYTELAAVDPLMTTAATQGCAVVYLNGASARNPLASPIHGDLRGLPPLLLQVGATEILLDDSTVLARRAGAAGVHVDLQIWPGMFHVWQRFTPVLPQAVDAVNQAGAFMKRWFRG